MNLIMDPQTIRDLINSYAHRSKEDMSKQTIMSIARIEHLENIWTNIYSYYLDETESHGLNTVFLRSLERMIFKQSGRNVNLSGAVVKREVATIKGNRIDLLIQAQGHSVIIENKVHHHLNNDLDDYWMSVIGYDESKTGIVLTLSHILINNPHFINITHLEWITEIEKEIELNHIVLSPTTSNLLYDFFHTVKHVSGALKEYDVNFYLENRVALNELNQVVINYRRWLQSVFTDRDFINSLGNFTLVHNDWVGAKERFAMYRLAATDELVFTVFYEPLWKSAPGKARLCIYLQPLGNWLDKAIANEAEVRSIASKYGVPSMDRHKDFWHCASVEIPVNEERLINAGVLKKYVSQYIADSDSGLILAAREISELLSQTHIHTYRWKDALYMLKKLIPEDNESNKTFWCSTIEFMSYDSVNHIVVLKVIDNLFRDLLERNYSDAILRAVRYAYGDKANIAYILDNIML